MQTHSTGWLLLIAATALVACGSEDPAPSSGSSGNGGSGGDADAQATPGGDRPPEAP